jgi:hypothetical protein
MGAWQVNILRTYKHGNVFIPLQYVTENLSIGWQLGNHFPSQFQRLCSTVFLLLMLLLWSLSYSLLQSFACDLFCNLLIPSSYALWKFVDSCVLRFHDNVCLFSSTLLGTSWIFQPGTTFQLREISVHYFINNFFSVSLFSLSGFSYPDDVLLVRSPNFVIFFCNCSSLWLIVLLSGRFLNFILPFLPLSLSFLPKYF